jgi:hypothetical protein
VVEGRRVRETTVCCMICASRGVSGSEKSSHHSLRGLVCGAPGGRPRLRRVSAAVVHPLASRTGRRRAKRRGGARRALPLRTDAARATEGGMGALNQRLASAASSSARRRPSSPPFSSFLLPRTDNAANKRKQHRVQQQGAHQRSAGGEGRRCDFQTRLTGNCGCSFHATQRARFMHLSSSFAQRRGGGGGAGGV